MGHVPKCPRTLCFCFCFWRREKKRVKREGKRNNPPYSRRRRQLLPVTPERYKSAVFPRFLLFAGLDDRQGQDEVVDSGGPDMGEPPARGTGSGPGTQTKEACGMTLTAIYRLARASRRSQNKNGVYNILRSRIAGMKLSSRDYEAAVFLLTKALQY